MVTDYYLILGVPRDANAVQVKRAYRTRSLRCHPDVTGPEGEAQFLRIKDAYDALSHPARRADHDRALLQSEQPDAPRVRSGPRAAPVVDHPVDLFDSFATHSPSPDALRDLFLRGATGRHLPKSPPVHALNVEMVLSPGRAAAGGYVPFRVPVARPCSRCDGTGRTGFFPCDLCDGQGAWWETARVDVHVPRGVQDGTVLPVSLRHLGVSTAYLNLHVRVAEAGLGH